MVFRLEKQVCYEVDLLLLLYQVKLAAHHRTIHDETQLTTAQSVEKHRTKSHHAR